MLYATCRSYFDQDVGPSVSTAIDYSLCVPGSSLQNFYGALVCRDGLVPGLPEGSWRQTCGPIAWDSSTGNLTAYCSKGWQSKTIGLTAAVIKKEWGQVLVENVDGEFVVRPSFLPGECDDEDVGFMHVCQSCIHSHGGRPTQLDDTSF